MRRLHLFEIHDEPWCPAVLRDGVRDFLAVGARWPNVYRRVLPDLAQAVKASGAPRIVDLCSGAGGPWRSLVRPLRRTVDLEVVLTDHRPRPAIAARATDDRDGLRYRTFAVDARAVPDELTGFRTVFNAFHHFPPDEARQVLEDAVDHGQGVAVFEITERSVLGLANAVLLPFLVWALTPFIRPFSLQRLFWTYVIPAIPLVVAFDGVVSCLRSYSGAELDELVEGLDAYDWDRGWRWVLGFPVRAHYLIGVPREVASVPADVPAVEQVEADWHARGLAAGDG